jgi:quercetin dioxygenase-like cupin family protein
MGNREVLSTGQVLARIMVLAGGAATEWHHHTAVNDFLVCLSGAVRVETRRPEGVELLKPGQRAEVSPPRIHRVVNAHDGESEYLLLQGVGGYDFIRD